MNYRISIIIILIVLIVAIFIYRRRSGKSGKERAKGSKGTSKTGGGRRGRKGGAAPGGGKKSSSSKESAVNQDQELVEDARELYGLVHEDMAQGMQLDEFEDLVGDLAGENPEEVYIELKQLYNKTMDNNMDPAKNVTLEQYIEVLDETD